MRRLIAVLLAAASVLVVAAGCSSASKSSSKDACIAERENAAAAAALSRGYEHGLISRAQIEGARFFGDGDRLFDGSGKLIPYDRLHGKTKGRFEQFLASNSIRGTLRGQVSDARARAGTAASDAC